MTADRARVAIHEACHASVAFELGRRLAVVSIRPTEHYGGISSHVRTGVSTKGWVAGLPAIVQPAGVRRWFESEICISLAGSLGEDMFWPASRYGDSEDERRAKALAAGFVELTKREDRILHNLEALEEPPPTDDETAWRYSKLISSLSDSEVAAHLAYLRTITQALLASKESVRRVDALVPILLERKAVSGRMCRAVFTDNQGRRPIAVAARS